MYVGASTPEVHDGGYGEKVLAERNRIKEAANQKYALLNTKKGADRI